MLATKGSMWLLRVNMLCMMMFFSDNNRRAKTAKRVVYENIKHKYYETHRD